MSTSDSRPAFRLPWQSSPDAEGTSEQAAATSQAPASPVEPPAWPHHDLIRRIGATPETGMTSDGVPRGSNGRSQAASSATVAVEPGHPASISPSANGATTPVHKRPTKFLADLTRAMRQAADESRDATLAQCQADVTNHVEAARVQAETAAGEARRRADEDIAALGEWSKAEMARIERETEANTAARRAGLDTELSEQQARLELELERVAEQAKAFEREMETFFVQLLHEEDPSAFATMASQLPDPPVFEPWRPDMDPTAADAPEQPTAGAATAAGTRSGGSKKGRAAAADASTGEPATQAAAATELSADDVQARIGGSSAGMPPMRAGDFAAAEAEAAGWATDAHAIAETAAHHPAADHDTTNAGAAPQTMPRPGPPTRPPGTRPPGRRRLQPTPIRPPAPEPRSR